MLDMNRRSLMFFFESPRMLEDHFDQTIPVDERKRLTDRCACGIWVAKCGN